jgi:hypothetical protein
MQIAERSETMGTKTLAIALQSANGFIIDKGKTT